jgi:transcriptional regulator with XRE-family HTH domain
VKRSSNEQTFRDQVGRRLHLRRTWLGLSQDDIARKAGLTRNFISAIERGTQGLDAWRLRLVADAIGVTLDWLLFGPNDEVTDPEPGYRPYRRSYQPKTDATPAADPADGTT